MVNYLHHIGKQYKCKRLSCFVFCFVFFLASDKNVSVGVIFFLILTVI